jgi:hypothetical protein
MTAEFTVRVAGPADAPAIARVHVQSSRIGHRGVLADQHLALLSAPERERMWLDRLTGGYAHEPRRVDVAVDRESLLGFIAAGPSREVNAPAQSGEIYALKPCERRGHPPER